MVARRLANDRPANWGSWIRTQGFMLVGTRPFPHCWPIRPANCIALILFPFRLVRPQVECRISCITPATDTTRASLAAYRRLFWAANWSSASIPRRLVRHTTLSPVYIKISECHVASRFILWAKHKSITSKQQSTKQTTTNWMRTKQTTTTTTTHCDRTKPREMIMHNCQQMENVFYN